MMPESLQPDSGPEEREGSGKVLKARSISHEENINRQLDRIAYLRSAGLPWAEAVFQLRDMVVGLEDEEFWTGIPEDARDRLPQAEEEREQVVEELGRNGWESMPMRAIEAPDGRTVYRPTKAQLSRALRIIMRLLARKGILWRTKTRTRFAPFGEDLEGSEQDRRGPEGLKASAYPGE